MSILNEVEIAQFPKEAAPDVSGGQAPEAVGPSQVPDLSKVLGSPWFVPVVAVVMVALGWALRGWFGRDERAERVPGEP